MKKITKILLILLIIIYIICSLLNYRGGKSIDDLAYTLALGIDKGTTSKFNVSFQFTKPTAENNPTSTSSSASSFVYNVETDSIPSAVNLMNSYLSKQVNLAHCKAIIFSEEVASQGISKEIYSLVNNIQIRPNTSVIVSKCTAKEFIENTEPDLESAVSQYYEITPKSNEYTGFTDNVTIGQFYNNLCSDTTETYAILGDLNIIEDSNSSGDNSSSEEEGTQYKQKPGTETIGLAVFKDDKFIGEMGAMESICHLIVTNDLTLTTITIQDPNNPTETLDLYLYKHKKNKTNVEFVNGAPYVTINCHLHARMLSVDENSGYTSEDTINAISDTASRYLEKNISTYLYQTSKVFHSDISGIGNSAIKKFITDDKWKNYNWNDNFQNSFFKVNVNTVVKSGYLLSET